MFDALTTNPVYLFVGRSHPALATRIFSEIITVPIWNVAPVDVRPEVELIRWRIMETDAGTRHFVGCETLHHSGQASSAIEQFDTDKRRGVTRSGRISYWAHADSIFTPSTFGPNGAQPVE
ncbi:MULTISPECIES: hypothetical protein [Paraburkholderia]|uniref:hypothetical protein n=1 Tax=Paraburkholderia TaxID=1822464 RepID=UPI001FEC7772|nr:hypothetical protein [Paraburkholderia podalyriae]